ncbi:MAG: oligosaccharide flippase family protein [Rhizobiales bacterium]|nr:oligosaccharide flippase family protein [Hyphomicrobiales bacterium]
MRDLLSHTVRNAPWALITSLCAGLSTYLILLILSQNYGLETSGQFRLLLSIVALIGLASLAETGKILIKNIVIGVSGLIRPLIANRLKWSLLGMTAGIVIALVMFNKGDELALPVLVASLLMPVSQSTRLFMQINQAKKQFRLNAGYNVLKFGSLVVLALVLAQLKVEPAYIFVSYFLLTAAFHVFYITRQAETFEPPIAEPRPYVTQSIKLSASGLLPAITEHMDKFLVSYFFGLETLGLYTIAVSTGRLILNIVKPVLTIYFGSFVNQILRKDLIVLIFVLLTCVGLALASLVKFYYIYVLPDKYLDGYPVSAVILCGLGCYTIGVVSYYSAVFHRESSITIPTLANVFTFGAMALYWITALIWGGSWTLILFAASYPLRELSNLIFITLLKARMEPA